MPHIKDVYKRTYLQNRLTGLENEPVVTSGERWGIDWEVEFDIYTLLCIKRLTSKDLCIAQGTLLNSLQ